MKRITFLSEMDLTYIGLKTKYKDFYQYYWLCIVIEDGKADEECN